MKQIKLTKFAYLLIIKRIIIILGSMLRNYLCELLIVGEENFFNTFYLIPIFIIPNIFIMVGIN